jgi:hypothetical protein
VIFITLMAICCWFLGAFGLTWGRAASPWNWRSLVWGSLTYPWLDGCACWFGGLLTCDFLVDHPLVAYLMVVEHAISLWYSIYA